MMLVNAENRRATLSPADGPQVPRLGDTAAAPLYEIAKRHISEAILLGVWPPGMVLPSEVSLAGMFGIAVGTVRRALADLTAEGLLSRRRKTGTVVTGRSPHHSLRFFFQYFRLHGLDGALVRSQARSLSVSTTPATQGESAKLQLGPDAPVLRLHRTRNIEGRPVMHDRFTLSAERIPGFPEEPDAVPELLYLHLLERYGIRISAVREQVTAELANDEDLALFGLAAPAAVLQIDEIAFDQAGVPTLLATHRAITAGYCYINEVR
jgi:GntR family transcriptional regulator